MILRSWLATLLGRIATSNAVRPTLRRRLRQTTTPQDVETLESRRLLTFTLNQAGFNFNLGEETSVYPYPNWSKPATTVVTSVNWTDTNTHTVGNVTVQNIPLANDTFIGGSAPNLAGGADGKAFRISPGGTITINNPADIDADVNPSFTLQITDTDDQNVVATTGTITITLIAIGPMQPVIPQFPYFNNTFTNFPDSAHSLGPTQIDNDIATETGDDPSSTSFPSSSLDFHPTAGNVNLLRVKENSPVGTVVGKVTANTPDSNDVSTLTYSFQGTVPGFSAADPAISIDPFTGVIKVIDPSFFNYEALRTPNLSVGDLGEGHVFSNGGFQPNVYIPDVTLQVQVRAKDLLGQFSQTTQPDGSTVTDSFIYIRVLDVGEIAPDVSRATTNLTVDEGTLNGDTVTQGAVVNGSSVGFFDMINGVSNIFSAFGPNYEVQDPSGDSVRVAAPASVIGLSTVEAQQRYSFKIVGGQTNNEFTITQTMNGGLDTGEIVVSNAAAIDYERLQDYTLQIQVTDDNTDADNLGAVQDVQPLSTIASVHIHINNINEQTHVVAPLVAKDAQGNYIKDANGNPEAPFAIPEGSVNGTVVGAAAVFQYPIDPNTGAPLVVNNTIVTPAVTGTIAVYDDDAEVPNPHAIFRYAITSGNNITINGTQYSGIFAIDPLTGVITVNNTTGLPNAQVLNFLQQQTFNITVQVSDVSVQSTAVITAGSASVEIDLKPVDSIPPIIQPGSATVREFTGASVADPTNGTTVGQVVASAGQSDFHIANYSIVSGNTVTINGSQVSPFTIDAATGRISISNVTGLDYEIQPVFNLLIKVTDNGSPVPLSSTATFTINLLNENDPITIKNTQGNLNFSVNENTPNNAIVGTIGTNDEDNLNANVQSQFFTISGGNIGGAFSIDAQGHILVANTAALDYEVNPTFSLIVTVTDTGVPATSDTKTVTINLVNVNDAPVVTSNQTFQVLEHRLAGTVIGTVLATDEDVPAQTLTFALTGTDGPANAIALDPNTGVLTVTDPHLIDFASTPAIHLTITATDNGFDGTGNPAFPPATSAPTVVTITLTDDQQPTLPQNQNVSIPENSPIGTVVTTEAVVPNTGSPPFTYSIIGGDANLVNGQTNAFAIDPNTGVIKISNPAALDFDTQSSFALRILVVDSAGIKLGDTATVTITLLQAYKTPVLSGIESSTLSYIEKATTSVSPGITVVDPDPVTIASATISISAGYVNGQDTLVFTDTATIHGSWNASNGTLTLTGNDTVANYTAALRSVAYHNLSSNPSTNLRTVSFAVATIDETSPAGHQGVLTSNIVTRQINVVPVNDPPVLSGIETAALSYTEGGTTVVSNTVVVTDVDSLKLSGAVIQVTGHYVSNQDRLLFTNTATITGTWDPTTGTLTLSGLDTLANYNAALHSVSYHNLYANPDTTSRTVSFTAIDDGNLAGNTVTRNITVIAVNSPPALIGLEAAPLVYTEDINSFAVAPVTSTIVATDPDSSNASGAKIQITGNYMSSQDTLIFTNTAKITGHWDATTGTLTLSGVDSYSNYRTAIRSVEYSNLSRYPNPLPRTLSFQISDDQGAASATVTRVINVVPFNVAPVLAGTNTLAYTEHDAPTPIDPFITVSDTGTPNLASATITMTNYTPGGQDVLGFVNDGATMGNITVQSNSGGVLTLTSAGRSATLAQWQSALEAVTYQNLSSNPSTVSRIVTYQVSNGLSMNTLSNVLVNNITIATVNDPPLVTNQDPATLAYTQGSSAVAVFPNMLVTDPKETHLSGATVQITGNYNSVSDTLLFTNTANITGSWNAVTGTLTLSGIDTVSNYRTALRSVKFFNQHDNVTTPPRTVSLTAVDDISLTSNAISRVINISTVTEPPLLTGIETSTHIYKANDPFTPTSPITSSLVVRDFDRPNLTGAVIQISGGYVLGQDRLGFSVAGTAITGSWNQATGTLTLSGSDTVAHYQAALLSVVYYNIGSNPSGGPRTVSFRASDNSNLPSNVVTRTVTLLTTNTPPAIAINSSRSVNYTQGNPAVLVAPNLTITDPDSPKMQSAFIKITGNYQAGQDVLTFKTSGNLITGVFDSSTGTLTLTGSDTVADYQAALQSVSYVNTSGNPSTLPRTINFVVNDGLAPSGAINGVTVTLTAVPQPPVVALNAGALAYTPSNGAVVLLPNLTITDPDSTTLASAAISISFNYQPGKDVLSFVNTAKITGVFNSATGTLQLSGVDTVANYRAALRSVTYQFNGTPITSTKLASVVVSDGLAASASVSQSINIS